jgi:FkbM family methyltransferase
MSLKDFARLLVEKAGFRVNRIREPLPDAAFSVFDLAIQLLHSREGSRLSVVQVGANDGVMLDPLRPWLQVTDWDAILVEPQPAAADRLNELYKGRPDVRIERCVITAVDGTATLYTVQDSPGVPKEMTLLASLDRSCVLKHRYMFPDIERYIVPVVMPALTLGSLIRKHGLTTVHLLQVDTEGHDFEIIKTIDFGSIRPKVINYEHSHLAREQQAQCRQLLIDQGYRLVSQDTETIAIAREMLPLSK